MQKLAKLDISKRKYKNLYVKLPSIIEVGKKYKRRIIDEKGKEKEKEFCITEILELDDGGLIIKSNSV